MKTQITLALMALVAFSASAQADGFVCESRAEQIKVIVKNHVTPSLGTRKVALLVISDTSQSAGNRTLVRSTQVEQNGADWTIADLDQDNDGRNPETKLGAFYLPQIEKVRLVIAAFNFNDSNKDGEIEAGKLHLFADQDGEKAAQSIDVECVYNTKN